MKVKVVLFICLITQYFGAIHYLEKYGSKSIYSGSGLVVLDVQGFNPGDSIYITYNSYDDEYSERIYYNFTDSYPQWEDPNILQNRMECYSDGMTTIEHNVSYGNTYRIYYTYNYHYFYEFIKPNDTDYLLLGYDLYGYHMDYIEVENTRFRRYIMTLIIVGSIIGFILVLVGGFFLYIYFKKCCRRIRERKHEFRPFDYGSSTKKTEKLIDNTPSTEMTNTEKKYDDNNNPDELPKDHPDYIYYPPQENLIDKPKPPENIITPSSQNITVENPIPQPQQDLGPNIPPVIDIATPISNKEPNPPQENIINEQVPPPIQIDYPPQENIINEQVPPPNQIEYPPQEIVQNNPIPPQNQEDYPSQEIVVNEAVPAQNEPNIPQENNNNPIPPTNQEQIPPQDNNNDNNQNPQQNEENEGFYSGGGGIYQ